MRCDYCGHGDVPPLLDRLGVCGLGCALEGGRAPLGVLVRIDGWGGLWAILEAVERPGAGWWLRLGRHGGVQQIMSRPASSVRELVEWEEHYGRAAG